MNKKLLISLSFISFALPVASQAYGAATLIFYAIDYYVSKEKVGFNQDLTQRAIREHITFENVIGAQKAKDALMDIVNALKNKRIYDTIGAKLPKGVLLEGNPVMVKHC